jgi:hypothetical protein
VLLKRECCTIQEKSVVLFKKKIKFLSIINILVFAAFPVGSGFYRKSQNNFMLTKIAVVFCILTKRSSTSSLQQHLRKKICL